MKNRRGKLIVAFLVAAVVLIMVPVGGRLYVQHAASQLKLPPLTTGDSTILASDDTVLGHIASSGGGHTSLTDAQVPDLIRQAHMAAEDRGFYKHGAVSLTGTAFAVLTDAKAGTFSAGGSTITQQYVKNAYLTQQKTVDRKYKELIYAYRVEKDFTKTEIIDKYVNSNYYGRGAYGVDDGAKVWFGVPATQLSDLNDPLQVARAAMLGALIRQPSYYDAYQGHPSNLVHAKELWDRTAYVLDGLRKLKGVHTKVSQKMVDQAKKLLPLKLTNLVKPSGQAADGDPYLADYVHDWLIAWQTQVAKDDGMSDADAGKTGTSTAAAMLARGGLKIKTSLNASLQRQLSNAVQAELPHRGLSAGVIILDPHSGGVAAMYGGQNHAADGYNYALYANRQVGSAMKPVVLTDAVMHGISVRSVLPAPAYIQINGSKIYNDDRKAAPGCQLNLANAMAESNNPVHVELISGKMASCNDPTHLTAIEPNYPVSPQGVADLAHKMGADDSTVPGKTNPAKLDAVPALSLGVSSLTPLKLAAIGGTLANGGVHASSYIINGIDSADGKELYGHNEHSERVVDTDDANIVNQVLTGVFTHGTAHGAQVSGHPLAGKTGTTNSDAWGLAFNAVDPKGKVPTYVCSAWAGYPDNRQTNGDLWGANVMRICQNFFAHALHGTPTVTFAPANLDAGKVVGLNAGQSAQSPPAQRTVEPAPPKPSPSPSAVATSHRPRPTPTSTRSVPPPEQTGSPNTGNVPVPGKTDGEGPAANN